MSDAALYGENAGDPGRRVAQVVERVIRERSASGQPADEQVVAAHPDLMPELGATLRALRRVEQAARAAQNAAADLEAAPVPREAVHDISHRLPTNAFAGYELIDEIHRGGQGIVYRAIQKATRREVAIKVLRDGPFSGLRDRVRFEREVRILAQLNHPNIVTIHDSGVAGDSQYFVMNYVAGLPLDAYVAGRRMSVRDALTLFARICDAISAAHLRGVIHRDLKPSNIVVDAQGDPQILDFGLAKLADESTDASATATAMTQTGQFLGSLPWASPEQAAGNSAQLDIRSDVYSLGVTLYHTLTGEFPYPVTGGLHDVLSGILVTSPIRPTTLRREIDGDVEAILLKCLAKEPERRYQGATALAEDIRSYLAGHPVQARLPSAAYHVRKLIARHRLPAVLLTSLFVLVSVSAIWTTVLYARAERESQAARAVNEFLVRDILAAAQPNTAPGRKLTVEEALANAAQRIDTALPGQPAAKASVCHAIGAAYLSLGLYGEAEHHLRTAESIRVALLGEGHPDTVRTRVALAQALTFAARFADAEDLARRNADAATAQLGAAHEVSFEAAQQYAETLWSAGKLTEAMGHFQQNLDVAQATFGAGDAPLLAAKVRWAWILIQLGRTAEAEACCRDALNKYRRLLGSDNTGTLGAVHALGFVLLVQGRPTEAEPLLVEAYNGYVRLLGEQHPGTLDTLAHLALLRRNQERLAEAESLYRQAVTVSASLRGPDHPSTLAMMESLGSVLQRRGDLAAAETVFREVVAGWRRTRGDEDAGTAQALDGLCYVLCERGGFEEAEAGHRHAFEVKRRVLGADHVNTLWSQRGLLRALVAQGKLVDARPIAVQLLEGRRRAAERPDADAYQLHCYARELLVIEPADLRDLRLAVEVATHATQLSPDDHSAYYLLALACEATGDYDHASAEIRTALALAPATADEARATYRAALERLLAATREPARSDPLPAE